MFHLLWKAHYYSLFCWLNLLLNYRYLGHCVGYMVIAFILLGVVVVVWHFVEVNPIIARRVALEHIVVRLQECSCKKGPSSSLSVLEGWTSNIVYNNNVGIEQIARAIDVMGKTNVRHQVEVCTTHINQHGVHNTIKEFMSNIDL